MTSRSFEATTVVPPADGREALRLAETGRDERTLSTTGVESPPGGAGAVEPGSAGAADS